jgi:hypothetical protein
MPELWLAEHRRLAWLGVGVAGVTAALAWRARQR